MLEGDDGLAGVLFELNNWQIPIDQVATIIEKLAEPGSELYSTAKKNVGRAAEKFNPDTLYAMYHRVYSDAATTPARVA
ncbi:hypothetical protein D3C78_1763290 [compost metagenome]